jgi:hypothetical protein
MVLRFVLLWAVACATLSHSYAQWGEKLKKYAVLTEGGESYGEADLDEVFIMGKMPSKRELEKGREKLAKFERLRWNVHKVYPYARKVAIVRAQIHQELRSLPSGSSQRDYLKQKEKALFARYEQDIRRMSRDQGRVLCKLVDRETNITMYDIIRENKNAATAIFWQGVGSIFGINLRSEFDPEEDKMIDAVVKELENGGYNMVYKTYNYVLQ